MAEPEQPAGSRTMTRTAGGLGLALLGVVVFMLVTSTPPDELWWGAPAVAVTPHLVAVAFASPGRPRATGLIICAVAALLTSLVMVLAAGFGLYQLPAVGLLLATAVTERDRVRAHARVTGHGLGSEPSTF